MEERKMTRLVKNGLVVVCGLATAGLMAGAISLAASQGANALPAYAQQTGKACGYCHQNPAGGGALKSAGQKFQANGHKL
jgi:hypothetical protein